MAVVALLCKSRHVEVILRPVETLNTPSLFFLSLTPSSSPPHSTLFLYPFFLSLPLFSSPPPPGSPSHSAAPSSGHVIRTASQEQPGSFSPFPSLPRTPPPPPHPHTHTRTYTPPPASTSAYLSVCTSPFSPSLSVSIFEHFLDSYHSHTYLHFSL